MSLLFTLYSRDCSEFILLTVFNPHDVFHMSFCAKTELTLENNSCFSIHLSKTSNRFCFSRKHFNKYLKEREREGGLEAVSDARSITDDESNNT